MDKKKERMALFSWYKHYKNLGLKVGIYEKEQTWSNGKTVTMRTLFVEGEEIRENRALVEDFVIPEYKHIEGFMFSVR